MIGPLFSDRVGVNLAGIKNERDAALAQLLGDRPDGSIPEPNIENSGRYAVVGSRGKSVFDCPTRPSDFGTRLSEHRFQVQRN